MKGGTDDVWKRVAALFPDRVKLGRGVERVTRATERGTGRPVVYLETTDGGVEAFDHVLLCCGGKAADLALGGGKSALEKLMFAQIRYNSEHAVLHTDASFLPGGGGDDNGADSPSIEPLLSYLRPNA